MIKTTTINSVSLSIEYIIKAVGSIYVGGIVGKYLGVSEYGELALAINITALLQVVVGVGLDGVIINKLAACGLQDSEHSSDNIKIHTEQGRVIWTAFALRLISACTSWIIALIVLSTVFGTSESISFVIAIATFAIFFQPFATIDLWLNFKNKIYYSSTAKIFAVIISSALRVFLVESEYGILAFSMAYVVEIFLVALLQYYFFTKCFSCKKDYFDIRNLGISMLKSSTPLLIAAMSASLYMRIDSFIVQVYLGYESVGIYAAAMQILAIAYGFASIVCTSVISELSKIRVVSESVFKSYMRFFLVGMLALGLFLIFALMIFSDKIINTFFGVEYSESATLLKMLSITCIPVCSGMAQNIWLINNNKFKRSLIQTVAGVTVSIATSLLLIPNFGLVGVAISAFISQVTAAFLVNLILDKNLFKMQFGFL